MSVKSTGSKYKAGNKKKVNPVAFEGNDYDEDEVEDIVMAETPVVTATVLTPQDVGAMQYGSDFMEKRKSSVSGGSVSGGSIGGKKKSSSNLTRKSSATAPMIAAPQREPSLLSTNLPEIKEWPLALRKKIVEALKNKPDEFKANQLLSQHRWPEGLKATVFKSTKKLPLRFFIVDDSGSMITNDGRRLLAQGNNARLIRCTRWAELTETMLFMGELSEALKVPSEFRLINGADPVIVGLGDDEGDSMKFLREVLHENPAGPTPLCTHINAVVRSITSIERELRANNQKAVVVIATDGESSDGNVAEALRPLTDLPVLVIVRLCTEEPEVVEYWNNIDNQLELDIDVIDDQLGDAKQIHEVNGWMTYGEPLHRLREFGATLKELDIIDESTLSSDQMRAICSYLYTAGDVGQIPHPGVEWRNFIAKIKELNGRNPKVFCPISQQLKPWVDVKLLQKFYVAESSAAGGGCSIS